MSVRAVDDEEVGAFGDKFGDAVVVVNADRRADARRGEAARFRRGDERDRRRRQTVCLPAGWVRRLWIF